MASKKESDVVLNFKTNGEVEYASTVKQLNLVMNNAAKEYKAQVSAMDSNATATEKLSAVKKKLETQLGAASQRTKQLREEYEAMSKDSNISAEATEKQRGKVLDAERAENSLRAQLDKTNDGLKEQGNVSISTAEKIQKISEAGEKVTKSGKGMSVGVTAPILAIGAAGISAFNEVDEAMDTVISKTGATGDQVDGLQEVFENVVGDLPVELQDAGEAIGEVNTQFGFTDKKLQDSTEYLLKYAEVNKTDVTEATIAAKQSIEAYGMSSDELNSVLDVTTKVAQETGQSVGDLSQSAIKGAPQIKAMNLSYGEGVTMLGQLAKAGVDGDQALSYLSKASVNYAADGKSLKDGLAETSEKIKNASSDTEALTMASEVFGTKGAVKMVDAIKRGTLNLDQLAASAQNSGGAVKNTFEGTEDPIDKAKTATNNFKIGLGKLGESIQIAAGPALEQMGNYLKDLSKWFNDLSPKTKDMIVKVGAVVAAIGPLLIVLGSVMSAFSKIGAGISVLKVAFGAISTAFTAIGGVIASIGLWPILIGAAIIAIVTLMVLNWDKITKVVKDAGKVIGDFLNGCWDGIKNAALAAWNFIKDNIGIIVRGLIILITGPFGALAVLLFDNWETIKKAAVNAFESMKTGVTKKVDELKNSASETVEKMKAAVIGKFNEIWNGATNIFNNVKNAIMNPINAACDAVGNAINRIRGFFDFQFKWPNIPLPHFSISGSFNPVDWIKGGKMPKVGVDWYAQGGIFTQPTIFGQNGNLKGAGEAGPEAALPLNAETLGKIGAGIAATMGQNNQPIILQVDGRTFAQVMGPHISNFMQIQDNSLNFGQGRSVFG